MAYEVWEKDNLNKDGAKPLAICYVIDTAIVSATQFSKGTHQKKSWASHGGYSGWGGMWGVSGKETVSEVKNACVVIDTSGPNPIIKGWATLGKYYPARDCKSCNNTGQDGDSFCRTCHGASFKPEL